MKKIFPGVIPVKGYNHTALYDLDRQRYIRLPNDSFNLSSTNKKSSEYNIIKNVKEDSYQLLKQNNMLIDDISISENSKIEYIQNYEWDTPSIISNAIIELSEINKLISIELFKKLINYLYIMITNHIHIKIIYDKVCMEDLKNIIEVLNESHIQTIQITISFKEILYSDEFAELVINNGKIIYVIIENSPIDESYGNKIFFTTRSFKFTNDLRSENFRVNVFLYSESLKHNTYFNKKIYIDKWGNIRNSPESIKIIGLFQKLEKFDDLYKIISNYNFHEIWKSNKDSCEICKDCEYRHMCVDSRIPIKISENSWCYQSECNYNPYIAKWAGEEGYVSVEECGIYTRLCCKQTKSKQTK